MKPKENKWKNKSKWSIKKTTFTRKPGMQANWPNKDKSSKKEKFKCKEI